MKGFQPKRGRPSKGANGQNVKGNGPAPSAPPPTGAHDQLPFDAKFFRAHFPHLIAKDSRRPKPASRDGRDYVVEVVLGDGAVVLDLSHVEGLGDNWALLAVFEDDGLKDTGGTRYVFVPYGAIARIEVVALESHARSIGFVRHTRARVRRKTKRPKQATRKKQRKR